MAEPTLSLDPEPVVADPPPGDDLPPPTPEFVFREYAPRIFAVARRLVGNEADAEDVTQDVLLQVVRKLHTFRGESQLPTWLHRVTVNAALALREKRGNRLKREYATGDEAILDAGDSATTTASGVKLPRPRTDAPPDELMLDREQRAVIERAIDRLPDGFRETYVLADVEGLPNADIAEKLQLSVPAVKSRLHRARLRMRELLAPHFAEEVGGGVVTCEELLEHLAAYIARELQADVVALLETHVGQCPTCGGVVETYRLTLVVVRSLPRQCDPLPDSVADRLKAALAREGFEVG